MEHQVDHNGLAWEGEFASWWGVTCHLDYNFYSGVPESTNESVVGSVRIRKKGFILPPQGGSVC